MDWNDWVRLYDLGYFDDQDHLRPELVRRDTVAQLALGIGNEGLSRSQARRFFQHCRRIEQKLKSGKQKWDDLNGDFFKLDIAAADALNKDKPKIPSRFHDFIKHNVNAVKSEHDFLDGFLRHFEALIGFGYAYFKKDQGAG